MAAGGMRSPIADDGREGGGRDQGVRPDRASRKGTPRTEAEPKAETPPKSGMPTAMPA